MTLVAQDLLLLAVRLRAETARSTDIRSMGFECALHPHASLAMGCRMNKSRRARCVTSQGQHRPAMH
jgi:hypothetical protein